MHRKKTPSRRCVGCGESKNKNELLRIVKTPEGKIVIDFSGRQNGRGAYLCSNPDCLKKARKNKGLERGLLTSIPEDVYLDLDRELSQKADNG